MKILAEADNLDGLRDLHDDVRAKAKNHNFDGLLEYIKEAKDEVRMEEEEDELDEEGCYEIQNK